MAKTNKTKRYLLFAGVALSTFSLALARFAHFKHFYELLVAGLFIAFRSILGKRIKDSVYYHMYFIFLVAGLIGDFIMGINITRLWHYSYSSSIEYLALYAFIYPFAGMVMVQSYVLIKNVLLKINTRTSRKPVLSIKGYRNLIALFGGALIVVSAVAIFRSSPTILTVFYACASALAFLLLSFVSQLHRHNTVVEDIHKHPAKIFLVLLLATYANAFLHEIPNTFAHEWVYTNYPLAAHSIFSVPVSMLLIWPVLLLIPLSAYYCVRS